MSAVVMTSVSAAGSVSDVVGGRMVAAAVLGGGGFKGFFFFRLTPLFLSFIFVYMLEVVFCRFVLFLI